MNIGARAASLASSIADARWRYGAAARCRFALEGGVFMGGATVQWLRDGLGIIEQSADVEALAASVPDTGDVYLVPAFAGLGAPQWDAAARGTIVGLTRGSNRAHLARAALESIAFQTADLIDGHAAGLRRRRCRNCASMAARRAMICCMQFQADLLGVPVLRPVNTETTAFGAAALAGLGVGLWQSEAELASLWTLERRFEPAHEAGWRPTRAARAGTQAVERSRAWATSHHDRARPAPAHRGAGERIVVAAGGIHWWAAARRPPLSRRMPRPSFARRFRAAAAPRIRRSNARGARRVAGHAVGAYAGTGGRGARRPQDGARTVLRRARHRHRQHRPNCHGCDDSPNVWKTTSASTCARPRSGSAACVPTKSSRGSSPASTMSQGDLSYPSGHAAYGYAMAYLLSSLVPERRAGAARRGPMNSRDNAWCAACTFASDLEAGRIAPRRLLMARDEPRSRVSRDALTPRPPSCAPPVATLSAPATPARAARRRGWRWSRRSRGPGAAWQFAPRSRVRDRSRRSRDCGWCRAA